VVLWCLGTSTRPNLSCSPHYGRLVFCGVFADLLYFAIEAVLDKLLGHHRRSFALSGACNIIVVLLQHQCRSFALSGACGILAVLRLHCRSFALSGACGIIAVIFIVASLPLIQHQWCCSKEKLIFYSETKNAYRLSSLGLLHLVVVEEHLSSFVQLVQVHKSSSTASPIRHQCR
jgi:hypothetical protein